MTVPPKFRISVNKYAENSKAERTREDYARRWRYFERWCTAHGLSALPATPHTLALFLFAHYDDWTPGTQNGIVWAIVDRHETAGHTDPADDPEVIELRRAVARARGTRPQDVKDPLRAEVLVALVDQPFDYASLADEIRTLRNRISATLTRNHQVPLVVQLRTHRGAFRVHGGQVEIMLPGEYRGRKLLPGRTLVLPRSGQTAELAETVARYLQLLPPGPEFPAFNWSEQDGELRPAGLNVAVGGMRQSLQAAARRARVVWSISGGGLSDEEFERMLRCCNAGYLHDLRDRTMIKVGWGAALRPSEICAFDAPVTSRPAGYELVLDKSKMNQAGKPETITVHHWPGCPPVCPACSLRFWLEETGITVGPLFPCIDFAVLTTRRCQPWAITAAIRHLADMAGLEGDWTAKSLRSGHITSRAERNEELEDIKQTSRHKTDEVPLIHYVLTRVGAGHHLGKANTA